MPNSAPEFTLAELAIVAASEIFRDEPEEVFATLIGTLPKLAGYVARATYKPGMMMSDGIYYLASEPVPLGPRGDYQVKPEGHIGYERVFTLIAKGNRHAFVGPVQVDKYGQMNLSCIGDYAAPKVTMLGVRGLPGGKYPKGLDHRQIITNLCVLDFEGPDHAIRVRSLHPGVSFEEVQDSTGFDLEKSDNLGETASPTQEQLDVIAHFDPHNLRARVFKDNPPGRRAA